MHCIILAGGLGTRMRPLTAAIPKCLIPVAGRPFAHWQLDLLGSAGVTDVVFAIGYLGDKIKRAIGDGRRWGLRVRYVEDGPQLAGTGGALRLACDAGLLPSEFAIAYGDSYAPAPLERLFPRFHDSGAPALMCVMPNHRDWERGNAAYGRDGSLRYDKSARMGRMPLIDFGITLMRRETVFELFPGKTRSDLAAVVGRLSRERRLAGALMSERSYEIGSPSGLAEFTQIVLREETVPA